MALAPEIQLRPAVFADTGVITDLIVVSSRELSRAFYSDGQIEAALAHIFGVDSLLIADGTYFVAEAAGVMCGCGGWSKRRRLFGGDQYEGRASGFSDPATEPAKTRAFFIHPEFARQGIARALFVRCETEAKATGYKSVELMSTLPGPCPFYRASGYTEAESITHVVAGIEIGFVPMRKSLA